MCLAADFETKRFSGEAFEWLGMARRRPQFQFSVAGGANLQQVVVATIVQLDAADGLGVAAVETFGEPQHRGETAHRTARPPLQLAEAVVPALGRRLAVVTGDQRDLLDLVGLEAAQRAVANQVVRVLVVPLVADVDADVVQDRGVLQPFAFAIGQAVNAARLIEQRHGKPCDLLRMLGPVVAAFGQLEHAAAADVGVAIGLRDLLAVPRDVVEHQAFAQRHVAQRDV